MSLAAGLPGRDGKLASGKKVREQDRSNHLCARALRGAANLPLAITSICKAGLDDFAAIHASLDGKTHQGIGSIEPE